MNQVSIAVDATYRRHFESEYLAWQRDQSPKGNLTIMTMPPMSGPDPNGIVTFAWVEREFLEVLTRKGIPFEEC